MLRATAFIGFPNPFRALQQLLNYNSNEALGAFGERIEEFLAV